MTRRTLLVTNDFPPRVGGIQAFLHGIAARLPPGELVVYASTWRGAADFDAKQPFEVVREQTGVLLPTPNVLSRARGIARAEGCEAVWFGAAAPLGLLAAGLRRDPGVDTVVATTHGHEVGWAMLPGARQMLRRIGNGSDVVTYLGAYTRTRLEPAFGRHPVYRQVASGVDTDVFHPGVDTAPIRSRYGLTDRPVVVCVSRLVQRKGQDMLVRALPALRKRVQDTALLLVGGGPYKQHLRELAIEHGVEQHVILTGSVPTEELAAHYAAGDVFAMPCRTRRRGLEVEGLGIVFLEASATGRPVVVGDSGGAPDAVLDGETGTLVDGTSLDQVTTAVGDLLADRDLATAMGTAGRKWVEREWRWETQTERLRQLLAGASA